MVRFVSCVMVFGLGLASPGMAQDAKAGEKVYVDQKCALCHSIGGKGSAKGPLDDEASKLTAENIRAWVVDAKGMTAKTNAPRKPVMKAYTLEKTDVDALVAYLSTVRKK